MYIEKVIELALKKMVVPLLNKSPLNCPVIDYVVSISQDMEAATVTLLQHFAFHRRIFPCLRNVFRRYAALNVSKMSTLRRLSMPEHVHNECVQSKTSQDNQSNVSKRKLKNKAERKENNTKSIIN